MPPGAEQAAIRELAHVATSRIEGVEERTARIEARVERLTETVAELRLALARMETTDATRQAQRTDWRGTAALVVSGIGILASIAIRLL